MGYVNKAEIKNDVRYGADGAAKTAPNGLYDIKDEEGCVGLCECDGSCDFTLSYDIFQQYVAEGRISLR